MPRPCRLSRRRRAQQSTGAATASDGPTQTGTATACRDHRDDRGTRYSISFGYSRDQRPVSGDVRRRSRSRRPPRQNVCTLEPATRRYCDIPARPYCALWSEPPCGPLPNGRTPPWSAPLAVRHHCARKPCVVRRPALHGPKAPRATRCFSARALEPVTRRAKRAAGAGSCVCAVPPHRRTWRSCACEPWPCLFPADEGQHPPVWPRKDRSRWPAQAISPRARHGGSCESVRARIRRLESWPTCQHACPHEPSRWFSC